MKRYVLTWSNRRRGIAGAFCPAGGLTLEEAQAAERRLHAAARAADRRVESQLVPYVFDVGEAFSS